MNEFQLSWRPPRTSSSSLTEIVPDSFITIVRPQKLQAFKRLNTLGDDPQVVLDASSETAPPLL